MEKPIERSALFTLNKVLLTLDGHNKCWICGSTQNIQTHHYGVEFALWYKCNPEEVKRYLLRWDVYGYSAAKMYEPLTGPDDIHNLMNLCETHHIAKHTGVHSCELSIWKAQKR